MKIKLSLFCLALAFIASNQAEAQHNFGDAYCDPSAYQAVSGDLYGPGYGGGYGGAPMGPGGVAPARGRLAGLFGGGAAAGLPGRLWLQSNMADRGLGYQGSYLTVGAKNRLFEDRFDGRWLMQGEFHHSLEDNGGFFSNIGLERIFTIDAANADVAASVFYDFDGDTQDDFSHNFHQVGVSTSIKTKKWDLIGNGYFPVGVQEYSLGDPTGANAFFGNRIALTPGIDAALEGFDVTWRVRPSQLAMINGSIDLGGYQYSSEAVNAFGGGRVRFGFQAFRGMIVSAEVNHDDRFDTTGVLSVGWVFGANGSGFGSEYSNLARDLESVVRNDHIVRFNQDVVVAVDPLTGRPYNVVHVNNTSDNAFEDGTAERPFDKLQDAQDLSKPGDVIAVAAGDGTDRNMSDGILLQDDQRLFGTGRPYLIPIQNGQFFNLNAGANGIAPTISNSGGFAAVTLANNNEVAGLNINGTGATFGIWGNGNSGNIHDNVIENATLDGIRIATPTGDWKFNTNTVRNNGRDGIFVVNALDTASTLSFVDNLVTGNTFDGIHLLNYDPATIEILRNRTNSNTRHGLFLENYLNSSGNAVSILNHTSVNNIGTGMVVNGGDGKLRIMDSTITNNGGAGISIRNWTSTNPTDNILVSSTVGGTSTINGNGAFSNLEFLLNIAGARSNAIVTNQSLNGGVNGLTARIEGVGTVFNLDVVDNISINNNLNHGIQLVSLNGATLNTRIGNSDASNPLQIIGNAISAGDGIGLIAQGANGQQAARINALIENVTINNVVSDVIRPGNPDLFVSTDGIAVDSIDNAVVDVTVRDSTIGAPNIALGRDTQNGIRVALNNSGNQLINRVLVDNVTLFSDIGIGFFTGFETYGDLIVRDSFIRPDGVPGAAGNPRSDNTPFNTDGVGLYGIVVTAVGRGTGTGLSYMTWHNSQIADFSVPQTTPFVPPIDRFIPNFPGAFSAEIVTDGVNDNLTRVFLENNLIEDFAFEGVSVSTYGDAQMLLGLQGNTINNNGAGFNNDNNNNNLFNEQAADGGGVSNPNQLFFYDGVNIDAFNQSTISTRIVNNRFQDNFERGLSLNTYNSATINASVVDNAFFGNDRGEDVDNTLPPIGIGTAAGPTPAISDSGFADFEAINNEEFYIRPYETQVLIALFGNTPAPGTPVTTGFGALPADSFGVFFPGNVGTDVFGNAVALGVANLNLSMSNNALQLGPDLRDFAVGGGDFRLGLDGGTNGFVGPFFGITSVGSSQANALIIGEESFFSANGFAPPIH